MSIPDPTSPDPRTHTANAAEAPTGLRKASIGGQRQKRARKL
ncbi:hypothetical protein [Flexivirga oryzae]|uniref:Uncharacterized protein n=1 Tax=Flexivirga oryzae TaxID=1794944 RepID=A0A839N2X6_9MICO|nr:hypothetical protein [Flexivirga oryzae]MBB2892078.1 hypothetical protein [Flexivirga oryzae]